MTKFAKVVNDIVVDVLDDPTTQVHPSLQGDYIKVPDGTKPGFIKNGRKYEAPVEPEVEAPTAAQASTHLTKLDFLRRFSRAERIALRAEIEADPVVGDFMMMLDLASSVDLADGDVIEGIAYLEDNGLLEAGRKDAILAA